MLVSVALAAVLSGPVQMAQADAAMAAFERLTAAALARSGVTAEERLAHVPLKTRLHELLIYTRKYHEFRAAGRGVAQDVFNLIQVTRDLVDAGWQLSTLPEERLCWARAGVDFATAHFHLGKRLVEVWSDPPAQRNQAGPHLELLRKQYLSALKECIPPR